MIENPALEAVAPERRFDFVVSNPPYVAEGELTQLAPEVRDHEPRVALAAGPTGTDVIARLVPQAAEHTEPGGQLLLEVGPQIHERVLAILRDDGRFEPGPTLSDVARRPRVVRARRR